MTRSQRAAMEDEAALLVVRAGAGSGKTRVLVERYLRLVRDQGVPPGRILAATFTEKAAAEMKERVAAGLLEASRPELVAEVNAAPICTLHSFCSRLVAPQALALGLDPGYRIIEEHEARLLQEETLTEILADSRETKPEALRVLVARLHWPGEADLRPGRSPSSRGFSRHFLDLVQSVRCSGKADQAPFATLGVSEAEALAQAKTYLDKLDRLLWDMEGKRAVKSQEKALAARRFLDGYLKLSDRRSPQALEVLKNLAAISLRVSDEIKAILRPLRDELCPILLDVYYSADYEAVRGPLNDLFRQFLEEYRARKFGLGVLDFLDLEEIALKILRSTDAPRPVEFILIDEAQDLNPVQWELIHSLSKAAPLFAVGDVQQSIYGFRDADVGLFTDLAERARSGGGREILLAENFRSRAAVLAIVNRFFERLWGAGSKVPFLWLDGQYPYPPEAEDGVELLLTEAENRQQAREREAQFLAHRLGELIRGGSFKVHREAGVDSDGKPILIFDDPDWGDILVLVRSSSSYPSLERAFRETGIPFVIQAGRGFWDALEISDLLALLSCLEDPGDDFSLACLLRSPAVGFSDDDLIEMRLRSSELRGGEPHWTPRSIYQGLTSLADSIAPEGSLPHRAARFVGVFSKLYSSKDRLPVRSLVQAWIEETGLETFWAQEETGSLMQSNVRKFLRLCDAQAGESPARLRSAFEELRLRDLREGAAPAAAERGAVQVMTVHSAKGLEAPVVALFDLNYQPRGGGSAFVHTRENGASFALEADSFGAEIFRPRLFKIISDDQLQRGKEEDQRVLYVAMTRAREKLILSASCAKSEEHTGRLHGWFGLLLKNQLIPAGADVLDSAIVPSGPIQIFDSQGIPATLTLRRSSEQAPSATPRIKPAVEAPRVHEIPAGFPIPPEPERAAISVVDFLRQRSGVAFAEMPGGGEDQFWDETGDGAELGLWVHRILQVLPLNASEAEIEAIARRESGILFGREPNDRQISSAQNLVGNFLWSPLAVDLQKASSVLREYPILFDFSGQLLKGKIDLAYEINSGWILVDYKSDRHPSEERVETYAAQLSLYAQAWKLLSGQLPSRALLFFLHSGDLLDVPLKSDRSDLPSGLDGAYQAP